MARAKRTVSPRAIVAGNSGNWSTMISRFTASGYPSNKLYGFNYNSFVSSDTASGAQLASYVSTVRARHGGEKVSIVSRKVGASIPERAAFTSSTRL